MKDTELLRLLLQIAKTTLLEYFDSSFFVDTASLYRHYPRLQEEGASFVTLHKETQLRGCIGSIIAYRTLLEDLISNTLSAALHDPRFTPLQKEELSSLTLEVSLLTDPKQLVYSDYEELCAQIEPYKDGLILQHENYRGTFLPQVWEQLSDTRDFLEHLSVKAGATPEIYAQLPKIYRYHVKAMEEPFDAILPIQE